MEPSIAGILICGALLAFAWFSEAPIIVALMASLAFGSTAIVTLSALGGASPLIYAVFLVGLVATVSLRRNIIGELGTVFARQPMAWVVVLLILYTVAGALLLPRLFEGQTMTFVPMRADGGSGRIAEVPLAPVTGNITQSLYFILTALSFFAFSVLLLQRKTLTAVKTGFFAWASVHAGLGYIDLLGKASGAGDVLEPVRSASYAMLTNVDVAGFWRIAGGYSEASAFGAMTVSLLAFSFTYWKRTDDWCALVLSLALSLLLVLSTSSTAYLAGALLLMFVIASIVTSAIRDRLHTHDLLVLAATIAVLAIGCGLALHDARTLEPFSNLFDTMILNKASSESGTERAYWNLRSLESVIDTVGIGIGIGSSRASSWIIAVVSQLGVIGTLMMGWLTLEILRGVGGRPPRQEDVKNFATADSARAACLAGLVTASISSGDADPGLRFYIALAAIFCCREISREALLAGVRPLTGGRTPAAAAAPGAIYSERPT